MVIYRDFEAKKFATYGIRNLEPPHIEIEVSDD